MSSRSSTPINMADQCLNLFPFVESGEYSDFTLTCDNHEFKLHQLVVCPQSSVIKTALSGAFQEAISKVVTVNEFDIRTVECMVLFLYRGDYEIIHDTEPKPGSDDGHNQDNTDHMSESSSIHLDVPQERDANVLISHLRINAIADYYDIPKLAKLATSKFRAFLDQGQEAKVLLRVVQHVSTSNRDPEIRSIIALAVAKRFGELSELEAFYDKDRDHDFSVEIQRACGKETQRLKHDLREAQWDVKKLQILRDDEQQGNQSAIEHIDKSMAQLKQTTECRNCKNAFGCYLEKRDGSEQSIYLLRCRNCRCRHTLD